MKRAILTLAVVLLLPAVAQAQTTVSPDKQAQLDTHGWTAGDDDAFAYDATYAAPAGETGDCAHSRARRAGTALRYASGNPMVRVGAKLAVCAANGHITKHAADFRHASPGRGWTSYLPFQHWSGWDHNVFQAYAAKCFEWYDDFHLWVGKVRIRSWVKNGTDHDIRFDVHRSWGDC